MCIERSNNSSIFKTNTLTITVMDYVSCGYKKIDRLIEYVGQVESFISIVSIVQLSNSQNL